MKGILYTGLNDLFGSVEEDGLQIMAWHAADHGLCTRIQLLLSKTSTTNSIYTILFACLYNIRNICLLLV